jgi:hypothetical protein
MVLRRLTAVANVATNASGLISTLFTNAGSNFNEFSGMSALFQEHRCLAMRLRWVPLFPTWGSTAALALTQGDLSIYPFRDAGQTALATTAQAFSVDGATFDSINRPHMVEMKMSNPTEAAFINTRQPAGTFAIGLVAQSLSVSTTYGAYAVEGLFQFRTAT